MKKHKLMSMALACIITAVSIAPISVQAKTEKEIQAEIDANKDKIDALEKEKKSLNNQKSEENSKLETIKEKLNSKNELLTQAEEKVSTIRKQINTLEDKIKNVEAEITEVEDSIEKNKEEISAKQIEKEQKEEILGKRLRSVYKTNIGDQFIYILLESKSIGDLISNFSSITSLVKTDNKLIEEINKIQLELEEINKNLADEEKSLQSKKKDIIVKQDELKEVKSEYDEVVKGYAAQVDELKELQMERKNAIESLNSEQRKIQNEIDRYEQDNVNLENYFNNNSTGGSVNASGFIRPTPGSITSPYGPRVHPVTGKYSTHTGVDFGASYGTPIKAAKGGVVTSATYHTAYGNMVIIDHGDGTSTLYAHASKFNTSVGKRVNQGDVIAYVGSTGYSTGAHLHFEIRINGQHVNPMNYL